MQLVTAIRRNNSSDDQDSYAFWVPDDLELDEFDMAERLDPEKIAQLLGIEHFDSEEDFFDFMITAQNLVPCFTKEQVIKT